MRKGFAATAAVLLVALGACSSGKQEASPAPTTVDCLTTNAAYALATTLATIDRFAHAGGATATSKRDDEDARLKFKPMPTILRKDWGALGAALTEYNATARGRVDAGRPVDQATIDTLKTNARRAYDRVLLYMTEFCAGPWTAYVKTFKKF